MGDGILIVSFDLLSMVFGLLLPFWFAFSVCIAVALGKRFETFIVGTYVEQTVLKNNELIKENQRLRKEMGL